MLVTRLARKQPATVEFVEARFSPLLIEPIIVAGQLAYRVPQSLDRIVATPYRERTSISDGSVTVERDGERTRTFSLRRAPELRGLLAGLSALFAGDRAALDDEFVASAAGSEDAWRLDLAPRDAGLRRRARSDRRDRRWRRPALPRDSQRFGCGDRDAARRHVRPAGSRSTRRCRACSSAAAPNEARAGGAGRAAALGGGARRARLLRAARSRQSPRTCGCSCRVRERPRSACCCRRSARARRHACWSSRFTARRPPTWPRRRARS